MRQLHLQHFRCYTDLCISLKPGINLLVGDNASGKTSLIKACQYVLSAFFAGFSDENTHWNSFDVDDFERIFVGNTQLPSQAIQIQFDPTDLIKRLTPEYLHRASKVLSSQILERKSPKGSRSLRTGIKAYIAYALWLHKSFFSLKTQTQVKPLPLFAYYSVEDIHTKRRISSQAFRGLKPKHSLGYLGCLDGDGFFRYWVMRLLILAERDQREELDFVRQGMLRVLGATGCALFTEMEVFPTSKEILFTGIDGRKTSIALLSEGQKRIVAIALDLAFRSYHLNHMLYHEHTYEAITGTVLIDEVDMHLHPSLQAKVLPALHQAYPYIQFVASSHAPMVMSGVESTDEHLVYKLSYDEQSAYHVDEVCTYGLDLSSLVEQLWGLMPRAEHVEAELKELFRLIRDKKPEEAHEMLRTLQGKYPDIPDLARAEVMLRFLR